jgi:hypothetical protein
MAKIEDTAGSQSVLPETRLPDDYRRVQADPEQFGGLIARGIEQEAAGKRQLGQGEAELGRGELDLGRTFGKVAANDAFNQANEQAQKILHGDPNKKDASGNPDVGYLGLTGRAALMARPAVEQQLDQLISNARDGMTTIDQQLEFDTISRKYRAQWTGEIGSHADAGAKNYFTEVNHATAHQSIESISRNTDPTPEAHEARKHDFADLIGAFRRDAVYNHGAKTLADGVTPDPNDPLVQDATTKAKQAGMLAWVNSVMVEHPDQARPLAERYKADLGDAYPKVIEQIDQRMEQVDAAGAAAKALLVSGAQHSYANPDLPIYRDVTWNIPGGFSPADLARYVRTESSGDPRAVSPTGYKGLGQFGDAEWKKYGNGKDIFDPIANLEATQRYAAANRPILAAALGHDPTGFEVALSLKQGVNGAIKLLQNPDVPAARLWPNASADLAANRLNPNAPASQVVAAIFRKWNNTDSASHPLTAAAPEGSLSMKQKAYQQIEDNTALSPRAKAMARSQIDAALRIKEVQDGDDAKAKKDRIESVQSEFYQAAGRPSADVAGLIAKAQYDPRFGNDWQAREQIVKAMQVIAHDDVTAQTMTNGVGYWDAAKRLNLPNDDHNRISSPSQLYDLLINHQITRHGFEALDSDMKKLQGAEGPEKAQMTAALHSVIAGYQRRLSWEGETDFSGKPKRDEQGEYLFRTQFEPQVRAMFSGAKTDEERWKLIRNTKALDEFADNLRPRGQMEMERLMSETAPGSDTQQTPIPVAPRGIEQSRWEGVVAQTPTMPNGMVATHRQYGAAVMILLNDPSPKTKERFNKTFGADGATADDVLAKLRGGSNAGRQQPVTVPPAAAAEPPPPATNLNDRLLEGPQSLQ